MRRNFFAFCAATQFETMAIKKTFGEELAKEIYVGSTKGQTGHALGAAGGLEAIACAKAIQTVSGDGEQARGALGEQGRMWKGLLR